MAAFAALSWSASVADSAPSGVTPAAVAVSPAAATDPVTLTL
ncbi:hypothetical protein AB0C12_06540 [Actinoplanes sp. NPDC048967]